MLPKLNDALGKFRVDTGRFDFEGGVGIIENEAPLVSVRENGQLESIFLKR